MSFNIDKLDEYFNPVSLGCSKQDFYKLFYYISILRYSTHKQLQATNQTCCIKLASKNKLKHLSDCGCFDMKDGVCIPNKNTLSILSKFKIKKKYYDVSLFHLPEGKGGINSLLNTDVFIDTLKLSDFYFLL